MINGRAKNNHFNHLLQIFMIICVLICLLQNRIAGQNRPSELGHAEQLIIVVGENWNSTKANLYGFEKHRGIWQMQFAFPAVLGKTGMALGEGIEAIDIPEAPKKRRVT